MADENHGHAGIDFYKGPNSTTHDLGKAAWFRYRCAGCGDPVNGAVLAKSRGDEPLTRWLRCTSCDAGSIALGDAVTPPPSLGEPVEGLPADVAEVYGEARLCFSHGAYTATELLCRKILMHIGVEKGAKPKLNFTDYVDHLEAQGYTSPGMKDWVDMIRHHGNLSTHELPPASEARANNTLTFTAQLLRIVYEMPHKAQQFQP
jgi:hypothetical protein